MDYETSGGVRVRGCAGSDLRRNFPMRFSPGDRVWIGKKVREGKMESVVLARAHVNGSYGVFVAVYADTFNRVWLEHELVDQSEAEELLAVKRALDLARARSLYADGTCFPIKPEACG